MPILLLLYQKATHSQLREVILLGQETIADVLKVRCFHADNWRNVTELWCVERETTERLGYRQHTPRKEAY